MANQEQLERLKKGVEVWNKWREGDFDDLDEAKPTFQGWLKREIGNRNIPVDLSGGIIRPIDLKEADLSRADLSGADLQKANLFKADLTLANLSGANLSSAHLYQAKLNGAKLNEADLVATGLREADLREADLRQTNLSEALLERALLLETVVDRAKVSGSWIYAVNVWGLEAEFEEQKDLVITRQGEPVITVDNIEIAQFIYMILRKEKIRDVINTLTSKSVLILGRFAIPERKAILDALKNKLREYDLLPIVFDFERPIDRDFTETIKTLAGLSYFVIADITNPKSSPLEL